MRSIHSGRSRRWFAATLGGALTLVLAGAAIGASVNALHIITPKAENQVTNLDVLRLELKNYYGAPGAATGPNGGWAAPLNLDSNYADEARGVAAQGGHYLKGVAGKAAMPAIVLDVDDTTLTTWNYELFSNWDFNPATNATFVLEQRFPATPGMLEMVRAAADEGYAIFFLTGRPAAQEAATLGNLTSDGIGVDAGYPAPTTIDLPGGGTLDGLFTKPAVGQYPAYLDTAAFCGAAIAAGTSCPTVLYKSGTRAYLESLGYDIVANFGDQFSDLTGGFADHTYKLPNPNYYLP
jgi:HAD superfamily, subfamily IIIB (Acid phosphatase)